MQRHHDDVGRHLPQGPRSPPPRLSGHPRVCPGLATTAAKASHAIEIPIHHETKWPTLTPTPTPAPTPTPHPQPTPRWLGASGAAAARVHYPPPLVAPLAAGDASSSAEDWGAKLTTGLTKLSDLVDETVVIKYGGHAMGSAEARASFARDVALLQDAGVRCVVVHGGGPMISAMLEKMGVKVSA